MCTSHRNTLHVAGCVAAASCSALQGKAKFPSHPPPPAGLGPHAAGGAPKGKGSGCGYGPQLGSPGENRLRRLQQNNVEKN